MNIIKTSENVDNRKLFKMVMSNNANKMRDVGNEPVAMEAWAIYEETDRRTGEVKKLLSVLTKSDEVVITNSPTFVEAFENIHNILGGSDFHSFRVVSGKSKNGRNFITCEYVD